MAGHRLTVTDAEFGVLVEALREALAAELLPPASPTAPASCSSCSTPSSQARSTTIPRAVSRGG
jgi:hypothetical protein